MFIAKNQQGSLINLLEIKNGRQLAKANYFCPGCGKKVILKAGQVKRAHFAHMVKNSCGYFSEGETAEHLAGKAVLFHWDEGGQLEVPLKKIQQRADVMLADVAIEFQCSVISIEKLAERIYGYRSINHKQWWLVGQQLKAQTLKQGSSPYCLLSPERGVHFWHVNIAKKCIELYYHLLRQSGHVVYHKNSFPYQQKKLLELPQVAVAPSLFNSDFQCWLKQKAKIQQKLAYCQPEIIKIQQAFYQLGLHLMAMPACLFCPSELQPFVGDWLFFLRFHFFQQASRLKTAELRSYHQELLHRFFKTQRVLTGFPLIEATQVEQLLFHESLQLWNCYQQKKSTLQGFTHGLPLKM